MTTTTFTPNGILDPDIPMLLESAEENSRRLENGYWLTTRVFDVVVSFLVTLSILIWLIPVLGLLIKLTSKGPALFVQSRTGYKGRVFKSLRFRTMRFLPNDTFRQAIKHDTRVTPIGRWLRATHLDEMPQFINVLFGDMSIVGPLARPIAHDAMYWYKIPNYPLRYLVKPGITGLAQLKLGGQTHTPYEYLLKQSLKYDLFYIRKRSLMLDLKIILWTLRSMLQGDANAW